MAEISNEGGGKQKGGKVKQKKISVFVDFTPMVDMNMLLITFFMLCTSLSKPQTMEIVMPTNKENIEEQDMSQVKESLAFTLLLDGDDKVYYFNGKPDYKNYNSLHDLSYNANAENSIRNTLTDRNREAIEKINELKLKKLNLEIADTVFTREASEIRNGKNTPTVIIKATDAATYKNLIDALDEMQICNIGKYVIDKIGVGDEFLIENKKTNGEHGLKYNIPK
ncbi:MAG: biopolymer transporter ExbD [Prevotellaceae bacterium]|jgi:biopolymer transport protein ExbD|nr:biopolymer transporter ExbD [Prevotellaceae bacterium]